MHGNGVATGSRGVTIMYGSVRRMSSTRTRQVPCTSTLYLQVVGARVGDGGVQVGMVELGRRACCS